MNFSRLKLLALIAAAALLSAPAAAALDTPARQALMIDAGTGAVLLEKDADQPMPPSSMSKLMTTYMVFERLAAGSLKLDDSFPVSEAAWRTGGSKMFVGLGERVSVEDLLRGVIVQSGNDACIVLAEGMAGDEARFAAQMTETARTLGLQNSTFVNSSGWPDPGHLMSPRDLAKLAQILIEKFPQYYRYFAEIDFVHNNIKQGNRNPLLYGFEGADGLKTGHTEIAGYGLTASAVRGDRRLILVLNGLESEAQRAAEAKRLLEAGFRDFENIRLVQAGAVLEQADVWLGKSAAVPLVATEDVVVTLQRGSRPAFEASVTFTGPIAAPIVKGSPVAVLNLSAPDFGPIQIPLAAGADVERLGFVGRVFAMLGYWLWGG